MSEETEKEQNVQRFLNLIRKQRIGKFKIYIGMSAGVGKSYRMLQEAHALLKNGIDVKIGYIEPHQRQETMALMDGLPLVPRRKLFYK
ncbi:MAG TPA: sensor protein KdpD, partial [Bacteroidia bacterium]|nr:sensor protein KdpD [Bacteroidia bacterium]